MKRVKCVSCGNELTKFDIEDGLIQCELCEFHEFYDFVENLRKD